jgi:hypothetical protein
MRIEYIRSITLKNIWALRPKQLNLGKHKITIFCTALHYDNINLLHLLINEREGFEL